MGWEEKKREMKGEGRKERGEPMNPHCVNNLIPR